MGTQIRQIVEPNITSMCNICEYASRTECGRKMVGQDLEGGRTSA